VVYRDAEAKHESAWVGRNTPPSNSEVRRVSQLDAKAHSPVRSVSFGLTRLASLSLSSVYRPTGAGAPNSSCQVRSSAYFPGSLCQRRLRDAKQRKRWRNALKSPGPARFSGAMLGSATFLCQKAVSANDNWRRPRSWIRPTKHGSKTICRLARLQVATHLPRKSYD
jgi:hypothetical protein